MLLERCGRCAGQSQQAARKVRKHAPDENSVDLLGFLSAMEASHKAAKMALVQPKPVLFKSDLVSWPRLRTTADVCACNERVASENTYVQVYFISSRKNLNAEWLRITSSAA